MKRLTRRILKKPYADAHVITSLAGIPKNARMIRENNRRVYFSGNRKFVETMPQSGVFKVLKKQL